MKRLNKTFLMFFFFLPFVLLASEFQVKVIEKEDDLPEKFCSVGEKDDFLISDGKNLVLIGGTARFLKFPPSLVPTANAMGSIISFVPAGKNILSDLNIGSPYIRIDNKREYVTYTSVNPVREKASDGTITFQASALYEGEKRNKAQINTIYRFLPQTGRIDITSTIKNTGKIEFEDLNYSLYFSANHRYFFNPFHRQKHPDLNFRVYQKKGHYLGWLNLTPFEDEDGPQPGNLAPGETFEVRYVLLVDTQYDNLLQQTYRVLNIKPEKAFIDFKDFEGDLMEVIVKDAFSSSVFFSSFLKKAHLLEIPLPKGIYLVRANFFPAVVEELMVVEDYKENSCVLRDIPQGAVKIKIRNSEEEFVPGKVVFIGLDPTKSPYFKPENPIETGKRWESFKNSCYPEEDGLEIKLPVGAYLIFASRGPEYSMDSKIVEILKNEQQELIFHIDRVVETENLISIDPHMHTLNSDGRISIPERLKSVVAEGLDVAVATDHNYVTNYYPTLKKLGLNKYLATIIGNEVTSSGMIHYNTYPLTFRENEENNGAIYPLAEEVSFLFEASRKKDPEAILQVNHPRAKGRTGTIGYFNNSQLDLDSASFARNNFDTSFDVLEVMNGPNFYTPRNYVAIKDWLHLLNRGYYFPLIGSSDSHLIDKQEPGYSRTYVIYEGEEGDNLNWPVLARAIKKGRSFTSNGPIVNFKVNNRYTSGDYFTAQDGKVDIWLKVQSAPWIAVDEVRLILNGERKIIFPVKTSEKAIQKIEKQISLKLDKDTYIIVEAIGKKSLFPVLQKVSKGGLLKNATLPYALTNPVFVDVDGNGKFNPPLAEKIKKLK